MGPDAFDLRLAVPFVVLADELHFGRAAERLGARQPALSQQLARLERQLGVKLVDRGGGRVALTPAGARFLVEVRELLTRARRAAAALRDGAGELRLHLGAAAHPVVGDILGSFLAEHPEIVVHMDMGLPSASPDAVRAGEMDAGFVVRQDVPNGLRYTPITTAPLGVATAVGHPIAVRGHATWTDLEGEPVFVAAPGASDGYNGLLRAVLRRANVRVREVVGPSIPQATYVFYPITTGALVVVAAAWSFDPLPPEMTWTVLEPRQHLEMGIVWDNDRPGVELVRTFVAWARARSPVDHPTPTSGVPEGGPARITGSA